MGPLRHLHPRTDLLKRRGELPVSPRYEDAVARSTPFALYILLLALQPALGAVLPETYDARWLYALQVVAPLAAVIYLWPRYTELGDAPVPGPWDLVLALGVGTVVFAVWIRLDFPPWVIGTSEGFDPRGEAGGVLIGLVSARLFGAALVVPIVEELFWRSFILRWLERPRFTEVHPSRVGMVPLLASSALFATEHHLWLAGLLAGLAYGWLYLRTANLWVPVIAHAVTNAILGGWVLATGSWTFW